MGKEVIILTVVPVARHQVDRGRAEVTRSGGGPALLSPSHFHSKLTQGIRNVFRPCHHHSYLHHRPYRI